MIKVFPDGTVELQASGQSCPPGFTGQAGNVSSVWFRVDGGPWEPGSSRSFHRHVQVLEWAASLQEFREWLALL